jgi:hypothetical protein
MSVSWLVGDSLPGLEEDLSADYAWDSKPEIYRLRSLCATREK